MRALLLAVVLTAQAAADPESTVSATQVMLQRAKVLVQDGKYLGALDVLLGALERSPDDLRVKTELTGVSVLLFEQDRKTRLEENERKAAVRQALAAVQSSRRKTQGLSAQLEEAWRQIQAQDSSGRNLLGASAALSRMSRSQIEDEVLRRQMSTYVDALRQKLYHALQSGAFSQPASQYAALGFVHYYKGDEKLALRYWKKALLINPADDALRQQAAWVEKRLQEQQRKETAAKLLEMAAALQQQGDYEQAAAQLRAASLLVPGDDALAKRAEELEARLRKAETESRLAKAKRIPIKAQPLRAVHAWLAVLDVDPGNEPARLAMQSIQEALVQEGASTTKPAAPASRDKPRARQSESAQQRYVLGLTYYAQNDLVRAKKAMEETLALDPTLQAAKTSLERIRSELGEP